MVTNNRGADLALDALGNQTRRDILALLREEALPVGDIAARLPISRPAVSKHLRVLENAGLVEYTTSGTRNIFRLRAGGFQAARAYVEAFWDEALANFLRVAEDPGDEEP
ncbi:MAG TPA: metalloregulator ArsR/SmtB family transcription factor [Chloroflexia bacterium]|jgi:DNA-binding transcriptional ArsR family regulator